MLSRLALLLGALLLAGGAPAAGRPAYIGIIIDDLGNHWESDSRAIELPGPVSCAILPRTPYSRRLAEHAHALGKEVMLHQPMQAEQGLRLGPGGLQTGMRQADFVRTLDDNLAGLPHVQGINNHMGSRLTAQPRAMRWLMDALREHGGLFFIDSRTTRATVAEQTARSRGLLAARRNVFLDNTRDPEAIGRQFDRLIAHARRHGDAIGIGHPYPETLKVLARRLEELANRPDVHLVPVSRIVQLRNGGDTWQASLSHSPKAAKN